MHVDAILISILKYCFIVELFEKWRSVIPPSPVASFSWATHLGVWRLNLAFRDPPFPSSEFQLGDSFGRLASQLGLSPCVKAPNPDVTQGGWLG